MLDVFVADPGGNPEANAPSLAIVRGYGRDDFAALLATGKALGDREAGLMSRVARARFSAFTSAERDALFDYLSAQHNERPTD